MAAWFSNISYLKQFTPKKMGAEVLILPFLISDFLKSLTYSALIVNLSCCTIAIIVNFLCCNSETNFLRRRCRRKVLTQSGGTTVKSCTNHIRMICTKIFCTASILRNISVRCDMDISCLYWKLESS